MNIFKTLFLSISFLAFIQCKEPIKLTPLNTTPSSIDSVNHNHNSEGLNSNGMKGEVNKPFYQGTVMEVIDAGGYTYLKIKEDLGNHKHEEGEGHEHKDFWIAVEKTPASIGDEVRFQSELVSENYKSQILNRVFDELMFASNLQYKVK
ncbi:MAG: hypothetical protein KAH07_06970 [Flavobacteriaceae bacterium]|nr:hypothetical protein [Flavobacteriaceae bacterium]